MKKSILILLCAFTTIVNAIDIGPINSPEITAATINITSNLNMSQVDITNAAQIITDELITTNINMNGGTITNVGNIYGGTYYGDGGSLTNLMAAGDVYLANNNIFTGTNTFTKSIQVALTNDVPDIEGLLFYDTQHKLLSFKTDIPGATLNIGDEMWKRIYNDTGATLSNGTLVCSVGVTNGTGHVVDLVVKATATNISKLELLGMITTDVTNNSYGWVTTHGKVHDVDTTMFTQNETVYLSDTPGEYSETSGYYTVNVGEAKLISTNGIIDVDISNVRNLPVRISRVTDGLSVERHSLSITNDGTNIFAEIDELVNGGDLYYIFDGQQYVLDCTTGDGTGGNAKSSALSVGTDTVPVLNYIYVIPETFPTCTLTNSTSYPDGNGEFAWIGNVVLQSFATTTNNGPFALQRWSDSISFNPGRGALSYERERVRKIGALYESGVDFTATNGGGGVVFSSTSGIVYQMHRQTFPAFSTNSTMYVWNDPTTPFKAITNFNQLTHTADGVVIGNNQSFGVRVIGYVASGNSGVSRLIVSLPYSTYANNSDAQNDVNNYSINTLPSSLRGGAFNIARVIIRVTGGGSTFTYVTSQDKRGEVLNATGSGNSAGPSTTTFSDSAFNIFNSTDSSKVGKFDMSSISASTTRTITFQDKNGVLAVTNDLTNLVRTNDARNVSLGGTLTVGTYDSYQVPTQLFTVNGTCTVTRANGIDNRIILTNNTTFAMADDWSTNGIGRVIIDINPDTFSVTLPTNTFYWTAEPAFPESTYTPTFFRKNYNNTRWEVKQ